MGDLMDGTHFLPISGENSWKSPPGRSPDISGNDGKLDGIGLGRTLW